MKVSATRATVKGHSLTVGDNVMFHGMVNDGFPNTEAGTLVVVGKDGAKYTLTSVDTFDSVGKPWVWTFGASAQFWASPVEKVEITEHTSGDVTLYSGKCVHGWQTGFYADRADAVTVAAGHGEVSIPTYEPTKAECVCDQIIDAGVDALPVAGRECPGCGSVFTRPQVPVIPTAAQQCETMARAHWANATSDDPKVSADQPGTAYRASRGALFASITLAYPDMTPRHVYDLWAEHGESVAQVVAFIRDTRADAMAKAAAYVDVTRSGADQEVIMEARVEARSAVYNALGYAGSWDRASSALSGMVCALYPTPDAEAVALSLAESTRTAWDAYTAPANTHPGMPVADWANEGDGVYRDRDGAQGVISKRLGDMVTVTLFSGAEFLVSLVALAAMDYEVIPAADMARHAELFANGVMESQPSPVLPDAAAHMTLTCTCDHGFEPYPWKAPRRISTPTRTKLNKRKRNADKRSRSGR